MAIDLLGLTPEERAQAIEAQQAKVTDYLAAAGTLKAGGLLVDAWNAFSNAKNDADALMWNADQVVKASLRQEVQVRKQHEFQRGANLLAMQEQGIAQDSGTGALILDEIARNTAEDAQAVLLKGKLAAIEARMKAKQAAAQGRAALVSGIAGAVAQGIGTYSDIQKV